MNDSVRVLTEQCKCREDLGVFSGGLHEVSIAAISSIDQGRISPYKFLVPCLSVRVKFTNQ